MNPTAIAGYVNDSKIDGQGRIVVSGGLAGGRGDILMARYLPDGSIDPTFGQHGTALQSYGINKLGAPVVELNHLVLLPDGKILAAGGVYTSPEPFVAPHFTRQAFFLARYLPDGTLDDSFGEAGTVTTPLLNSDARMTKVVVQPDGKIVAIGAADWMGAGMTFGSKAAIVRYSADGVPDVSFGSNGISLFSPPDPGMISFDFREVKVLDDGNLAVITMARSVGVYSYGLAHLTQNGHLDPDFGINGLIDISPVPPFSFSVEYVFQPDGKILGINNRLDLVTAVSAISLSRRLANGELDPSFAGATTSPLQFPPDTYAYGGPIIFTESGDIRLLMNFVTADFSSAAVVGYFPDGRLDPSFGRAGFAAIDTKLPSTAAAHLLVQSDQSVVVVGTVASSVSNAIESTWFLLQNP